MIEIIRDKKFFLSSILHDWQFTYSIYSLSLNHRNVKEGIHISLLSWRMCVLWDKNGT